MASVNKQNNYEQVYNVSEDPAVLSQATLSLCVIMPRGVWVAAYNGKSELVSIHYTGYSKRKPVWQTEFYEQLFATEPLLAKKDQVAGVFLCTEKNMIVPDALYDAEEAKNWLARLHMVEPGEMVQAFALPEEKTQYVLAVPVNIIELIKINFKRAKTLPFAYYQLNGHADDGLHAYCCVTPEQVCISVYNDQKLQWHRIADFSVNESLAFNIKHYCREHGIDDAAMQVHCTVATAVEYDTMNGLSHHYPTVWGKGEKPKSRWVPAISLANQLLSCV